MNFANFVRRRVFYLSAPLFFSLFALPNFAEPVTIHVGADKPGAAIPGDFTGLSFEVSQLLPGANGQHYFRPDNEPLIHLFRSLGIKNLRIGGNTSDRNAGRLPTEADFDSLFGFAKAADVKVIYCLRLYEGDAAADVATVKYIMGHYAPYVEAFSIGQEPSAYPAQRGPDTRAASERMGGAAEKYPYSAYRDGWKKFEEAIVAAVPEVKFCGPSVHNNANWAKEFLGDFGQNNHVALITEHLYPGGAGGKVPTPEIGRARMLGADFTKADEKLYNGLQPLSASTGLPYRLEEANNYFNGGATNVSSTFAAALWGLDFMYWWAEHDCAGLNFHTGDRVSAGASLAPSRYTAFFTGTNGYVIRPLGYGIKAFDIGSHGRRLPVNIDPTNLNLTAYAILSVDKHCYVTVINKENGDGAREAEVKLEAGTFMSAQIMFLTAPNIADTSGLTLGGAGIGNDGGWEGKWTQLTPHDGTLDIKVAASTAAIVELQIAEK
jgi:hypothetical protein